MGCGAAPTPAAPTEARMEVPIVLFSTPWCPACAQTRDWLYARGLIFRELDVHSSRGARSATTPGAET